MAMLHFEGDKDFTQAPAEVWAKLSDPRFLVQCIPDVQSVAKSELGAESDVVVCTIRPGFSFVRGALEVTLRVTEAVAGGAVRLSLQTRGIGSSSRIEANLTFTPQDSGTRLHWTADLLELGGLLKAVPKGLIQASAQKVINDAWTAVSNKLA